MPQSSIPVGNIVQPITRVDLPQRTNYEGKFVRLLPVNPQTDAAELYELYQNPDQQLSLTALNRDRS